MTLGQFGQDRTLRRRALEPVPKPFAHAATVEVDRDRILLNAFPCFPSLAKVNPPIFEWHRIENMRGQSVAKLIVFAQVMRQGFGAPRPHGISDTCIGSPASARSSISCLCRGIIQGGMAYSSSQKSISAPSVGDWAGRAMTPLATTFSVSRPKK